MLKLTAFTNSISGDTLTLSDERKIWNVVSQQFENCQEDVANYSVALDQCFTTIESAEKEKADLREEIELHKKLNKGWESIIDLQEQVIEKDALILKKTKTVNRWEKFGWAAGGFTLGAFLTSLANIILVVK